jgi:hypothetical protein
MTGTHAAMQSHSAHTDSTLFQKNIMGNKKIKQLGTKIL